MTHPESALPEAVALFERFSALGIASRTTLHAAAHTVEDAQALRGDIPGAHAKNLFVKDKKGRLFLVTALEEARLDLKRLHETIGGQGRVTFASADQMRALLGIEPGSVTPFAAMNDTGGAVTVVLQAALMEYETLNFHPMINTATTTLSRADLIRFLDAVGHPPMIVALPEAAPSA